MFRKMRRSGQAITHDYCIKLLKEEKRAVLSVNGDDGYPYSIPINYFYDEIDGKIYIHSARNGHKIDAIRANSKVCFTLWGDEYKSNDWAYYVRSVVIMGRAELVEDRDTALEKMRSIGLKYYPSEKEVDEVIERAFPAVQIIAVIPEHMTGKLVNEA